MEVDRSDALAYLQTLKGTIYLRSAQGKLYWDADDANLAGFARRFVPLSELQEADGNPYAAAVEQLAKYMPGFHVVLWRGPRNPVAASGAVAESGTPEGAVLGWETRRRNIAGPWRMPGAHPRELLLKVQATLTDDLLLAEFRKQRPERAGRYWGHCAVATEALYHLLGGTRQKTWIPTRAKDDEGITHWWLRNRDTGEILDPTAEQYRDVGKEPPYKHGQGGGFQSPTRDRHGFQNPSVRALKVLQEVHGDVVGPVAESRVLEDALTPEEASERTRKGWEKRKRAAPKIKAFSARKLNTYTLDQLHQQATAVFDEAGGVTGMNASTFKEKLLQRLGFPPTLGDIPPRQQAMAMQAFDYFADMLKSLQHAGKIQIQRLPPFQANLWERYGLDYGEQSEPESVAPVVETPPESEPVRSDGRVEHDGFFDPNQTKAYYQDKLKSIGAPEEIQQVVLDFSGRKPFEQNTESPEGDKLVTKWDGKNLYHYERGSWGFKRVQIDSTNGYVDFGYGYTEDGYVPGSGQGETADTPADDVATWSRERKISDWKERGIQSTVFKSWFGDWEHDAPNASKVVDADGKPQQTGQIPGTGSMVKGEDGKPIAVYHGTSHGGFSAFDPAKIGDENLYGPGFYFTEDEYVAESYKDKGLDGAIPLEQYQALESLLEKELPDGWKLRVVPPGSLRNSSDATMVYVVDPQDKELNLAMLRPAYKEATVAGSWVFRHFPDRFGWDKQKTKAWGEAVRAAGVELGLPEVKAVYLNIRKPFDVDARHDALLFADVAKVADAWNFEGDYGEADDLREAMRENLKHAFRNVEPGRTFSGEDIYVVVKQAVGDKRTSQFFQAMGYDGLTHIGGGRMGGGHKHRVWIAFQPEQVKATDNQGTFDQSTGNIYESASAEQDPRCRGECCAKHGCQLTEPWICPRCLAESLDGPSGGSFLEFAQGERCPRCHHMSTFTPEGRCAACNLPYITFGMGRAFQCPECGGLALTYNPETESAYRGSAVCVDCGHGFAAVHADDPGWMPGRRAVESWDESKHPRDRGKFAKKDGPDEVEAEHDAGGSVRPGSGATGILLHGLRKEVQGAAAHPDWKFANTSDLVAQQGQDYPYAPKPDNIPQGEPNSCYNNAYDLMDAKPGRYTYVEGFVLPEGVDLPILHAWVVTNDGKVLDNTLETPGRAYRGIPMKPWYVRQMRQRVGAAGVLANQWKLDFELLQNGLPDNARRLHESWDESQHPRDRGRFADKPGAAAEPVAEPAAEHPAPSEGLELAVAVRGKDRVDLRGWTGDRAELAERCLFAENKSMTMKDGGETVVIGSYPGLYPQDPTWKAIHVDFVATKRPGYGRQAMAWYCALASKHGKGVTLDSVGDAVGFYRALGMKEGKPERGRRLIPFTFTAKQAAAFAKKYGGHADG